MENKLVAGLISLYLAILLYTQAFFVKTLTILKGSDQLFWNHIMILVIFFLPIFYVVNKHISVDSDGGLKRYLKLVLLIIAIVGLVISVLYHIVPIAPIYHFPSILNQFFAPEQIFTVWLIAPLAILLF